jgi:hypothetical protein
MSVINPEYLRRLGVLPALPPSPPPEEEEVEGLGTIIYGGQSTAVSGLVAHSLAGGGGGGPAEVGAETNEYYAEAGIEHRQALGQFYTGEPLRKEVFNGLDLPKNAKILEPSVGSGLFVEDALKRGYRDITSVEFDDTAYTKFAPGLQAKGVKTVKSDYLLAEFPEKFDAVIGNPPYFLFGGKHPKMSAEVREKYKEYFTGNPDIYTLFLIKGLMDLKVGGVLSYVIPLSVLTSANYQKQRDYIHKNSVIEKIYKHKSSKEFKDANVDVMVLQLRKTDPDMPEDLKNDFIKRHGGKVVFEAEAEEMHEEIAGGEGIIGSGQRMGDILEWKLGTTSPSMMGDEGKQKHMSTEGGVPLIYVDNIKGNELTLGKIKKNSKMAVPKGQYINPPEKGKVKGMGEAVEGPFIVINGGAIGKGAGKHLEVALVRSGRHFIDTHVYYAKAPIAVLERMLPLLRHPVLQKRMLENVHTMGIGKTYINNIVL